jgi:hypothetical protein
MAAAVLLIAPLLSLTGMQPSGALPVGNSSSCKNSENKAAEMGMFPASPASQSQLKVSCLLESDVDAPGGGGYNAGSYTANAFTVHDFDQAVYHNGAARVITATGGALGGNTITFSTFAADPITGWVNRAITGTGIAPRTFVTSVTATTITLSENLTAAATGQTYRIDNAAGARSIDSGTLSGNPTHLTTVAGVGTSGNFTLADQGLSVSGTRIPKGCTIATFNNANDVTLSCLHNGNPTTFNSQVITIGGTLLVTSARRVDDAISGAASTATRVSTSGGLNATSDVGLRVYGTNLDADTTVASVSGAGNLHLNLACAAPPCNNNAASAPIPNLRIGDDSGTAPADGEQAMDLGTMLDLAPSLVPGTASCSLEEPEGFHITGVYRGPDNFAATAFGGTIPSGVPVLGQIQFPNSAGVDFAAYIVQKSALSAGDPDGAAHYDIVVPDAPTGLAACPQDPDGPGALTTTDYDSPGQALSITVNAATASSNTIPSGTGRPGTAQFRALKGSTTGYASTIFVDPQTPGVSWVPAANFNRLCVYPATAVVAFTCGNG